MLCEQGPFKLNKYQRIMVKWSWGVFRLLFIEGVDTEQWAADVHVPAVCGKVTGISGLQRCERSRCYRSLQTPTHLHTILSSFNLSSVYMINLLLHTELIIHDSVFSLSLDLNFYYNLCKSIFHQTFTDSDQISIKWSKENVSIHYCCEY